MTDEAQIRRALLRGGGVAKAHELALMLEHAGRIEEAIVITEAALREGPDFGKGELSGVTLLDALSATWSRLHRSLGRRAPKGIYNEGLATGYAADWPEVLARADRLRG